MIGDSQQQAKINNPKEFFKDSPHAFKIENIPLDEIEAINAIAELSPNAANVEIQYLNHSV